MKVFEYVLKHGRETEYHESGAAGTASLYYIFSEKTKFGTQLCPILKPRAVKPNSFELLL